MAAAKNFNNISCGKVTRGHGLFERFLACKRAKKVNSLIPDKHRKGRLIDIGCGCFPVFLTFVEFAEKFGIDKINSANPDFAKELNFVNYDVESNEKLPFPDGFADIVTMLAVLEHFEEKKLLRILLEIRRVLKPGGLCIITVPSTWSHNLLKFLSWLYLVSRIEIAEHKSNLSKERLLEIFAEAGFKKAGSGYFELFLNRWFVAEK